MTTVSDNPLTSADAALVLRAQAGDAVAGGILIERYQPMVLGLCRRFGGDEAEDWAHDAFIEAFQKIVQVRQPARFGGWLRALVLNLCRMRRRQRALSREELAAAGDGAAGEDGRLGQAMEGLSQAQRLILGLHYWEGLPYDEIARLLDIPPGTVMSRLYRARRKLKERLEMDNDNEPIDEVDERFRREVGFEIEILHRLGEERPDGAQRLAQILQQDPERLDPLVATLHPDEEESLARLLTRSGRWGLEAALQACFSSDGRVRANALLLLRRVVAEADGRFDRHHYKERAAYFILDRLLAARWPAAEKAEVLLELSLVAAQKKGALTGALLCYCQEALPLLMERFWEAASPEALHEDGIMRILARVGDPLAAALLPAFAADDVAKKLLAAQGLKMQARCLYAEYVKAQRPPRAMYRHHFPELGPQTLDRVRDTLAGLLDAEESGLRDRALEALGGFGPGPHLDRVRACLGHAALSTRLAALRLVSRIGDRDSVQAITPMALQGEASERRFAVETLGRLGAGEAVVRQLLADPEPRVRQAAAIALGEIGGDENRGLLEALVKTAARPLAKAAASALYGGRRKNFHDLKAGQPSRRQQLTAQRLEKVRGDKADPYTYRDRRAAVAALPEIRGYPERELTFLIAQHDYDYALTRRQLIVEGIMTREGGVYELTELGQAMWRVERFIAENYLTD